MKIHYGMGNIKFCCHTHYKNSQVINKINQITCKHCTKQLYKYYIGHKCYHKAKTAIVQYIQLGGTNLRVKKH